ncbi:extracellular solute-binding protein [Bacillus sp. ISL-40]|uniref:ABC transporter substrate-binding protein n=1 Tax=unclassified Bacillus (in: firmicutes) TaxID=185979 RepID=UPI001BE63245|nr:MULTISPECIES: extracellular solute-binding protein [unclassified Bacillus (in: firmicutes)]MBT2697419.1 extracellular solute-binding protein [Bacillus sp. ISL-40]MBT2721031.1 extracellular solute-binding protein [Bacillus sp. ISL-46]MBT2741765.1 extracellular solute-binding protein [Bacillus sp. ISL-77]
MKKSISLVATGMLALSVLAGCGSKDEASGGANGKVKIEFLEYKSEAKGTFNELAKKFEKENPNIDIVVTNPPDAVTVLKTRVAKRDLPDVIGMGGDVSYAEISKAGAFKDVSKDSALNDIQPAYIDMLKDISKQDKVYGIPYAANANAVIYNKAIFKELGIEVPTTWEAFIAAAEKVKAAGKIPFYFTFKDAWTALPAYNVLAANTQGEDFFKKLDKKDTKFAEGHKEAAEKLVTLLKYGHKDQAGKAYNDGNVAFAKGESAMYLQGIWAIPEIKKANPNIEVGVFPYPIGDSKVVSGVDLLLAQSATTKHPKEAKKFIEFLLSDENMKKYLTQQNAFSAKTGVVQEAPELEGLKVSFEKGAVVDFPDHYVPTAVALEKQLQVLTQKKNVNQYLKTLDTEWEKVANRK